MHSLIFGDSPYLPEVVNYAEIISKHSNGMDFGIYGLFDTASPNFSNYYPTVKKEDFTPNSEDFIHPVYRALSEVTVHRSWNPVNFAKNGVLQESVKMLRGQTIYPNHEMSVGNELGSVEETFWEEKVKLPSGIVIPAGINARMKLDAKSNPKIARAINMNPPAIHSTSVTVQFLWEKSHAEMSEEDFYRKIGTFDEKGKLIERICTKILRYFELSLVPKGADPFAQKKGKDGSIPHPEEAAGRNLSASEKRKQQKFFFFDYATLQNSEEGEVYDTIENEETIPDESIDNDKKDTIMNKAFLLSLATIFGIKLVDGSTYTEENITEDIIKNHATSVAAKISQLSALLAAGATTPEEVTRLKGLETELASLKASSGELLALKAYQDDKIKKLREKTIALASKLNNSAIPESLQNMLNSANEETLTVLHEQYTADLDKKYPLSCKACNSTDVSRASSAAEKEEESPENGLEKMLADKRTKTSLKIPGSQDSK